MPLNIDWQQILLHLLNFSILTAGLYLILFKPVKKFMDERKEYFRSLEENTKAEAERVEAMRAELECKLSGVESEVGRRLAEAETAAADRAAEHLRDAEEKADKILSKAREDGENEKKRIIASAQNDIAYMVVEATEKLVAEDSTPEHDKALYDLFIAAGREESNGAE